MTLLIAIAAVCLTVLIQILRKGLRDARKAAEDNKRLYREYYKMDKK